MEPVIMFVMILTIGGHDFVSVRDYPEQVCLKLSALSTVNTNIKARCVPNLKNLPEGPPEEMAPQQNFEFPFRPPPYQSG